MSSVQVREAHSELVRLFKLRRSVVTLPTEHEADLADAIVTLARAVAADGDTPAAPTSPATPAPVRRDERFPAGLACRVCGQPLNESTRGEFEGDPQDFAHHSWACLPRVLAHYAACAHAIGVEHAPSMGPTAPGPVEDVVRHIEEARRKADELEETKRAVVEAVDRAFHVTGHTFGGVIATIGTLAKMAARASGLERELEATKRAKTENDDRFMTERDAARIDFAWGQRERSYAVQGWNSCHARLARLRAAVAKAFGNRGKCSDREHDCPKCGSCRHVHHHAERCEMFAVLAEVMPPEAIPQERA